MNVGDKIICINADAYHELTEGKVYQCLYGLEDGIFETRPFVTVIGDNGEELRAHASRFKVVEN